ncbi:MAG: hypothetical protein K6B72_01880 [Lachnospiraceae bacterium]|nr:hypothetical protein [Lachnospiraceae bacterium]
MNTKKKNSIPAILLSIIQHLLAAGIIVSLMMVKDGQSVVLNGPEERLSYRLYESDQNRSYEDTALFNNILGNNLSLAVRYAAICSQMETNGLYNGDKVIDVTAYVNRNASLPGDYITVRYTLSNLIKWAQNGFVFETMKMSPEESGRFLAEQPTYTHIVNNSISGGMNSYLNSQIEGNTVLHHGGDEIGDKDNDEQGIFPDYRFYEQSYDDDEGGTQEHSILINRYRTVDGQVIEDMVSSWQDYQTLCTSVVEAAKSLLENYEEYQRLTEYFAESSTSMRYYIARTLGGRQEVYTNVASLRSEPDPENVSAYFSALTRHLFFCPYDLSYETDTLLKQETVRTLFKQYSYAYPDQIRVYAGADLSSLTQGIDDDFHEGRKTADAFLPSYRSMQFLAIVFGLIYLLILCFRILSNRNAGTDVRRVPTELLVLLWIVPLVFLAEGLLFSMRLSEQRTLFGVPLSRLLPPVLVFFISAVFTAGLLALLRKKKSGSIGNDSLFIKLGGQFGEMARFARKNVNIAVTTIVFYTLLVLLNLIVTAAAFSSYSAFRVPVMLCLVLADIFVGVLLYRNRMHRSEIIGELTKISKGEPAARLDVKSYGKNELGELAECVNSIGEGIEKAVKTSMHDERLKSELITNVSHDIKTPLTSIIGYVDLLKRENIDSPKAEEYIRILDEKSQQLKRLTEDLVEASKITSGNIEIKPERLNVTEFLRQTVGEFHEKLEDAALKAVVQTPEEPLFINADANHLWRVMENLLENACKYALSGTRVYLQLSESAPAEDGHTDVVLSVRNVSRNELHVDAADLTERFVRGDMARSGEGSGLGLSIADSLTKAQGGEMQIDVDGDLFKVTLWFPKEA